MYHHEKERNGATAAYIIYNGGNDCYIILLIQYIYWNQYISW